LKGVCLQMITIILGQIATQQG